MDKDFKVMMNIANAFTKSVNNVEHMFIRGLASGLDIDLQDDRMAKSAVEAISKAIDEGTVLPNGKWSLIPLRSGHKMEWDDILGWITKAEIDDQYNLWIEAELDSASGVAEELFVKLNRGEVPGKPLQLGLSVGGKIKKASHEWNHELQKRIRIIEDVLLQEVSVTGQPANPCTYIEALAKSVNWADVPIPKEEYRLQKEISMSEPTIEVANLATTATDEVVKNTETQIVTDAALTSSVSAEPIVVQTTEEAEVEKQVTTEPQAEEVPKTDPIATTETSDLVKQVAELQEQLTALQLVITKLSGQNETETVAKSEEASPVVVTEEIATTTELAKSTSTDDERLVSAITAAFEKFTVDVITPLTEQITLMKSAVDEIGEQPNDKSSAVRKNKEEDSRVEAFYERLEKTKGGGQHFNPIRVAIEASLEGRE